MSRFFHSPQVQNENQVQAGPRAIIEHTNPSIRADGFDNVVESPQPEESILHPVKALHDILAYIERVEIVLKLLYQDSIRARTPIDKLFQLGASYGYEVHYQERKYVFLLSSSAFTLALSTGGTIPVYPNVWLDISLKRGTVLTVNGGSDTSPTAVLIRHTDNPSDLTSGTTASPSTPSVTSVSAAASDTLLLAANANRKQAFFYNDSTATLYLLFGTGVASTSNYSVQIGPQVLYEVSWPVTNNGFHGIWSAANGAVKVTELT